MDTFASTAKRGAVVQHYNTPVLDASLLLLPLVGFIAPTEPMRRSTLRAVDQELGSDNLVYRYNPSASPGRAARPRGDVLHRHLLVRGCARPLRQTGGITAHVREDGDLCQSYGSVFRTDRADGRADLERLGSTQ